MSKTLHTVLYLLVLICLLVSPTQISAQSTVRFGVVGDSNSDEYRADDNRGGSFSSVTFNWIELLQRYRGFNVGSWGTRSEPRRTGYEYNWARSASNTAGYVSSGQHTGLAAQVASGNVTHVFVQSSENDFHSWNGTYAEVYNGTLSGSALQQKVNKIVSDTRTIVTTLQAAGNVQIVISTHGDKAFDPQFVSQFPDASKRQRVTNALNSVNQGLKALAQEKNVGVFDTQAFLEGEFFPRLNQQTMQIRVGNQNINMTQRSNDPRYLQLGDGVGHVGTVGSGLYANGIVAAFNAKYGNNWQTFSDQEILSFAGLGPAVNSPTPQVTVTATNTPKPTATFTPTKTPTPKVTATPSPACNADIDQNGTVNLTDYSILSSNFFSPVTPGSRIDISKDGVIDLTDYSMLATQFLKTCP